VHISSIEHYISDTYFDKARFDCAPKNGMKAAIIGSGPAGITIAILLARKGYGVTIFESRERIGGVLQYGIPDFRLPKTILERFKEKLMSLGIRIRPNTTMGGALEVKDLFRDGYRAIFIGTGVWRPKTLNIEGESLGNVHFAIDYLANPCVYNLGERVAIIGAGNAAMDVARTALREGKARRVTVYSRSFTASASPKELEYALIDGADIRYGLSPVRITERGPVFEALEKNEETGVLLETGRYEQVEADSVIISVSQRPKNKLVQTTEGLKANADGRLIADEKGNTTSAGIFAAGDVVNGAKTVVEAVAYSKIVAGAMDEYMRSGSSPT
jgi:glutamate synthase (NADPH/NADH) small chain